jgi:AAHS family 4-hydroxybenzoate transporter-like MFS transporter
MKTVDVGLMMDEGPWRGYQKLLVLSTALAIVLDGVDNQLLSVSIPGMMKEWGLTRAPFTHVAASGFVGMMIGGAVAGVLGDRFGRRKALIGSVFTFALVTCAIVFVGNVWVLAGLRFLGGLGLGGAMPNAAALASEYVPRRYRPMAVTLTVVCIPLGGSVAGLVGARLLPTWGWRTLFAVGGVLPIVLGIILLFTLPESPRFLARQRARWTELRALLRRLGHSIPEDAEFTDPAEAARTTSMRELMVPELRRDTVALSAAFFFCLLAAYASVSWLPSMLAAIGFDPASSSNGLLAWNLGGVGGALIGAGIVTRLGSRTTMIAMCIGAVAGALLIRGVEMPSPSLTIFILFAWTGGLINGVQTLLYALAANVYPATIRATGVGTAVAFGRIGGVVSAYAGLASGLAALFALLAGLMGIVAIALAVIRRHIPRAVTGTAPAGAYARARI